MSENSGYAAYVMFQSLKLHFSSKSYDYFKYHGKTNTTKDSFEKRKDKYTFYKISRKYTLEDMKDFYVSNLITGDIGWVGDMIGPVGEENYRKWQKRNQSLTYQFESDIMYLFDNHKNFLKSSNGEYPQLLTELMQNSITLETVVILNKFMNFLPTWKNKISDDIIWPKWNMLILKYTPFVVYNDIKCKNLLITKIDEYVKT